MSHVTQMNELYHTYVWFMSKICMRHVTHRDEQCDMTHSYARPHVWHDAFIVWHDSFICSSMSHYHSYVWHDSFIWIIHTCDMTHAYDTYRWARIERVMSLIWMSHVTRMNDSCHHALDLWGHAICCSALQSVAVRCNLLQCVAIYCGVLQFVVACCKLF